MTDAPRMTERRVHNSSVADNPTFPEFVDYLIRTPPNIMDKHWAPYTKVEIIRILLHKVVSILCCMQVCVQFFLFVFQLSIFSAFFSIVNCQFNFFNCHRMDRWLFKILGNQNILANSNTIETRFEGANSVH